MKIVVRKRLPLVLYIPNRMLRGRLCTFLICEALRGDGIPIDQEQLAALLAQCRDIFAQHRGLRMVEVHAADGTHVTITL